MDIFANAVGVLAVVMFNLSYQLKARRNLIICNASARILYVIQYLMLGAYSGAVLDVTALFVSLIYKRAVSFDRRRRLITALFANAAVMGLGLLTYESPISLLPIVGVIFETTAMIPKEERRIRALSLLGAPPWLVYNLLSGAYGSAVGNVITLVTIGIAMLRYDLPKKAGRER